MSGEAASRARLGLPGRQRAWPGRPRPSASRSSCSFLRPPADVPWLFERAGAVVATWFPGSEAGHAVADVLTGRSPRAGGCR